MIFSRSMINILSMPLGVVILEAVEPHKGLKFVIDTTKERNILFAGRVHELGYDVLDDWDLFSVTAQNGREIPGENGLYITDFIIDIKLKFNDGAKRAEKILFEYSENYKEYQEQVEEYVGTTIHGVLGLPFLAKHQYILKLAASMCRDKAMNILETWGWTVEDRKHWLHLQNFNAGKK